MGLLGKDLERSTAFLAHNCPDGPLERSHVPRKEAEQPGGLQRESRGCLSGRHLGAQLSQELPTAPPQDALELTSFASDVAGSFRCVHLHLLCLSLGT